jgi:GPI inositol-deacylase
VLFIPGNAGSSRQVRSIASSAARQYFHSPGLVSPEFSMRSIKPLDVYAVEFNEDFSAFHGPTLLAERSYVLDAIKYISSLYPPDTQIMVLGHSMGGVVAISLLPSVNISAIITMSTPHTLPPARFDRRIGEIFRDNQAHLKNDPTPVVSLCGGATDLMIPSETCILPTPESAGVYRSTLFTSALEGSWTGVGHREMVWCHQVRWQVARTALELSGASTVQEQTDLLNKWLRDGNHLPRDLPASFGTVSESDILSNIVPPNENLVMSSPKFAGSRLFYFSVTQNREFVLYVSQGTVRSISPYRPISLKAEIFRCEGTGSPSFSSECSILYPSSLRLLPSSHVDQSFPVPQAGSDETEGIVLFEANLTSSGKESWIAVKVDGADGRGWLVGGFVKSDHNIEADVYMTSM